MPGEPLRREFAAAGAHLGSLDVGDGGRLGERIGERIGGIWLDQPTAAAILDRLPGSNNDCGCPSGSFESV